MWKVSCGAHLNETYVRIIIVISSLFFMLFYSNQQTYFGHIFFKSQTKYPFESISNPKSLFFFSFGILAVDPGQIAHKTLYLNSQIQRNMQSATDASIEIECRNGTLRLSLFGRSVSVSLICWLQANIYSVAIDFLIFGTIQCVPVENRRYRYDGTLHRIKISNEFQYVRLFWIWYSKWLGGCWGL